MIAVRLDPETEEELSQLAKETGRSKSYYVRRAIREYLSDRADYVRALAVLEQEEPRRTVSEVRQELGLED